jgi:hypothetical protein
MLTCSMENINIPQEIVLGDSLEMEPRYVAQIEI